MGSEVKIALLGHSLTLVVNHDISIKGKAKEAGTGLNFYGKLKGRCIE